MKDKGDIVNTSRSSFARALASLLDDTNLFTRAEWASILDITEAAISQWVNDHTLPSPRNLLMIVRTIEENENIPTKHIRAFRSMTVLPAEDVTPHASRVGRTVADYLTLPHIDALQRHIAALPADIREFALRQAAGYMREALQIRAEAEETISVERALAFLRALASLPQDEQSSLLDYCQSLCSDSPSRRRTRVRYRADSIEVVVNAKHLIAGVGTALRKTNASQGGTKGRRKKAAPTKDAVGVLTTALKACKNIQIANLVARPRKQRQGLGPKGGDRYVKIVIEK